MERRGITRIYDAAGCTVQLSHPTRRTDVTFVLYLLTKDSKGWERGSTHAFVSSFYPISCQQFLHVRLSLSGRERKMRCRITHCKLSINWMESKEQTFCSYYHSWSFVTTLLIISVTYDSRTTYVSWVIIIYDSHRQYS